MTVREKNQYDFPILIEEVLVNVGKKEPKFKYSWKENQLSVLKTGHGLLWIMSRLKYNSRDADFQQRNR